MTDARSKLFIRILLGIAVLVAALMLLYTVALLRPTGYGEMAQEIARGEGGEAGERVEAILAQTRSPGQTAVKREAPARPRDYWLNRPHIYSALAATKRDNQWTELGGPGFDGTLHWEAFPASFGETFLSWSGRGLGDLQNGPSAAELEELNSEILTYGYRSPDYQLQLEWRFAHAAIVGDHDEALNAMAAWTRSIRSDLMWESYPTYLHQAMRRMLEMIAALEKDVPPEVLPFLDDLLAEQLERYGPSGRAGRIDASLRAEFQRALDSDLGDDVWAEFMNGALSDAKKKLLLPLLRKELEHVAVAVLKEDMEAYDTARKSYDAMKARFPNPWPSTVPYGGYDSFNPMRERELTLEGLRAWVAGEEEREKLLFHRFVLDALAFRYDNVRWPEKEELKGRLDDGSVRQYMLWQPKRRVFLVWPQHDEIEEAARAYREETQSWSAPSEDLLPSLPDNLMPIVQSRFFEAGARPSFFRSSSFGEHHFVPTAFSDAFRRFMRGEQITASENQ